MSKYLFFLALLLAAPAAWADSSFSLGSGFDYSTGKYGGDTTTNILYIPLTGTYQNDQLTLKLTVPYIRVTGTGTVVQGMGRIGRAGSGVASTRTTTQSGLGDVIAAAAYNIYGSTALAVDVAGKVKFGTASANQGLGTGENDYAAQADAYYALDDTTLLASLGYKIVGAPAGGVVNNIAYAALGISHKLDYAHSAGVMLDVAQAATELAPGTRELSVFMTGKVRPDLSWRASLLKGLSDASADYGIACMLTGTY